MGLVDEDEGVLGQEVKQGVGSLARLSAGEVAGVVLDAGAGARLAEHLEVEVGPLAEPLRLQQAVVLREPLDPLLQLDLDVGERQLELRGGRHVVGRRKHLQVLPRAQDLARGPVHLQDPLDLVAEELDPEDPLLVGRHQVDDVAPDPEAKPRQVVVVALVLELGELAEEHLPPQRRAALDLQRLPHVILRRADSVDAADAGDDDHVAAGQQGLGGRVTKPVDLLVPGGILLDVGVGAGDVRLRLVVVVVADEVLDRVLGEQPAELGPELRRQRLVGAEDQRRALEPLDRPGHHVRLPAPGDAHEDLLLEPGHHPVDDLLDRLRLIPGGLERCTEKEGLGHRARP